MFGGGNDGNTKLPILEEENPAGYDSNSLPQFKLFGRGVPVDHCVGATNHLNNGPPLAANCPIISVSEVEPIYRQSQLPMSMNNNFSSNGVGHIGTVFTHSPVSTGLRLSCPEARNSSYFSPGENTRNTSCGVLSLGDSVKLELDRHAAEFDRYMNHQEENLVKGVRELNQRHIVSILSALEKGVNLKLQEKQNELENIKRKNKELDDRMKQSINEAETWRQRATYNEAVTNLLKSNIQHLMAQANARVQEGSGDSELDGVSSVNHQVRFDNQLKCRACERKEVSVLLLPCRHLCLCIDCEGLIHVCPICQEMKTASLQVNML